MTPINQKQGYLETVLFDAVENLFNGYSDLLSSQQVNILSSIKVQRFSFIRDARRKGGSGLFRKWIPLPRHSNIQLKGTSVFLPFYERRSSPLITKIQAIFKSLLFFHEPLFI
ncbi:hypothetical protein C0J52_08999 [Blattella germanica]|nr:hypothetical protein C0J52_08999 [Blattella germanica]